MDGWVGQGTQHAALYNIIQDYIAAGCEKHAQGFYTAAFGPSTRVVETGLNSDT